MSALISMAIGLVFLITGCGLLVLKEKRIRAMEAIVSETIEMEHRSLGVDISHVGFTYEDEKERSDALLARLWKIQEARNLLWNAVPK